MERETENSGVVKGFGSMVRLGALWLTVTGIALAFSSGATDARTKTAQPPQNAAGKDVFEANCVACHGEDGSGTPTGQSLMAPDLRSDDVQKRTDDELKKQVSDGKNNMPPFKDVLNADQINAVVAYVRTFASKK